MAGRRSWVTSGQKCLIIWLFIMLLVGWETGFHAKHSPGGLLNFCTTTRSFHCSHPFLWRSRTGLCWPPARRRGRSENSEQSTLVRDLPRPGTPPCNGDKLSKPDVRANCGYTYPPVFYRWNEPRHWHKLREPKAISRSASSWRRPPGGARWGRPCRWRRWRRSPCSTTSRRCPPAPRRPRSRRRRTPPPWAWRHRWPDPDAPV